MNTHEYSGSNSYLNILQMKKYIIRIIIVIVLLVFAIYLYYTRTHTTIPKELRDFAIEDTSVVTKIFMVNKNNEQVTLERKDGYWTVNNKYIARKDAIDMLLKTMHRIDVRYPVSKSAHNTCVKNLAVKSTKVEIYQGGKLVKTYFVGGPTQDQRGTYMLLEKSSKPFIMHIPGFSGYLSTRYFINEALWRSPAIFRYKFNEISSVTVENPSAPEKSFKVFNYGDNKFGLQFLLKNINIPDFDTLAVKRYISYFKRINYDAIVTNIDEHKRDSVLSSQPMYIITVEDTEGEKKCVKTFLRAGGGLLDNDGTPYEYDVDRMYAFINNDKDMVIIQYFVFDPLFMEINNFGSFLKTGW